MTPLRTPPLGILLLAISLLSAPLSAQLTPACQFIPLPSLGGRQSGASAVNNAGFIVGWSETPSGQIHACLWIPSPQGFLAIDLSPSSSYTSFASDINDAGWIVGHTTTPSGISLASLWIPQSPNSWSDPFFLNPLTPAAPAVATALNASNLITGWSSTGWQSLAVTWPPHDSSPSLPAIPSPSPLPNFGGSSNYASAINDLNQIVGWAQTPSDSLRAFLWNPPSNSQPASRLLELGTLGGTISLAHHINNLGHIVGQAQTPSGSFHAFLWDPHITDGPPDNPHMKDLGTLGGPNSAAFAINHHGYIVGSSETPHGPSHAVLWDPFANLYDLHTLLASPAPWTLQAASDINDLGWIVGWAIDHDGFQHAFLLLPSPSLLGDTNADGTVDLADYNNVINNLGATGSLPLGDTNSDHLVDLADYNNVINNLGAVAPSLCIPQPASLFPLILLLLPHPRQRRPSLLLQ